MSAKSYPNDVIEQGHAVLAAWRSIDPALKVGELAQTQPVRAQIDQLEAQLTEARNQREALSLAVWDKVKRVRRGVQAIYGDDSSQYEVVGGTRVSDRKPVSRSVKQAA